MADLSVKLGQTLVDLLKHRPPTVPRPLWETNYHQPFSISESPNKQATSNACELVWALNSNQTAIVHQVLDWFKWLRHEPFMPKEHLSGEDVYRLLTSYPTMVAAGVADQIGDNEGKIACLQLARAHFAWLLLGIGMTAGRKVIDHHLNQPSVPCVLIGTSTPNYPIRYVAQAGKRAWIRNREKNQPKVFLFTDHSGLSCTVYQGLGLPIHRKVRKSCKLQVDLFEATMARWPALPAWGLGPIDFQMARSFFDNPINPVYVGEMIPWLLPTSLPCRFVRFHDGSVVSVMERGDSSSTDSLMLDACYSGGETRKTSADDGLRNSTARQVAWEEDIAFACKREDGQGPTMRIPKPPLPVVAWRVFSKDGQTWLEGGAELPAEALPITPDLFLATPASKVREGFWSRLWHTVWGD